MKIIDDFLPEEDFAKLQEIILGDDFAWFYNKTIAYDSDDETVPYQFTHSVFDDKVGVQSGAIELFKDLFVKIGIDTLIKAKLNLGPRVTQPEEGGWHTDYPKYMKHKTAVFFLNTNNGYTKFEDGTVVESVANRFAEFDSDQPHTGVSQTDTQVRVVLNLNYILEDNE